MTPRGVVSVDNPCSARREWSCVTPCSRTRSCSVTSYCATPCTATCSSRSPCPSPPPTLPGKSVSVPCDRLKPGGADCYIIYGICCSADYTNTGVDHNEGGWPRDDTHDPEAVQRYRRRVENEDGYIHSVMTLAPVSLHMLLTSMLPHQFNNNSAKIT